MTTQPTRIWLFDNNQPKPEGLQPGDLALNTGPYSHVFISTAPSVPDGVLERGVLARWDGKEFQTHGLVHLSDDNTATGDDPAPRQVTRVEGGYVNGQASALLFEPDGKKHHITGDRILELMRGSSDQYRHAIGVDIRDLIRAVGENTRRLNESLEKLNAIHLSVVELGEEDKS